MFFIYNLQRFEFFILVALVLAAGGIFYYFSVKSRKTYECPECGEKLAVEHMESARCGMCGSELNHIK
ncbi:MAG: hypothetical protein CSB24_06225 [Deltaproteobacteria bacterium]|nr:MAG: hypothetical protein CSB24_06225 [Deltaproteobacteria bacterium]